MRISGVGQIMDDQHQYQYQVRHTESRLEREDDNLTSEPLLKTWRKSKRNISQQIQLVTILLLILAREIINQTVPGCSGLCGSGARSYLCRPFIIPVAAENDEHYAEASADSPSVDSLDDDDDNEELDSSASNEYPDGDNDNDESYDDADDDRQESRTHDMWLHPDGTGLIRNDQVE